MSSPNCPKNYLFTASYWQAPLKWRSMAWYATQQLPATKSGTVGHSTALTLCFLGNMIQIYHVTEISFSYPKNPDPSKVAIGRNRTPAIQVHTPPLEGPRTLRVETVFLLPNQLYGVSTWSVLVQFRTWVHFCSFGAIGECTYWFWKIQLTMVR